MYIKFIISTIAKLTQNNVLGISRKGSLRIIITITGLPINPSIVVINITYLMTPVILLVRSSVMKSCQIKA